jgi:hypothetical protein
VKNKVTKEERSNKFGSKRVLKNANETKIKKEKVRKA